MGRQYDSKQKTLIMLFGDLLDNPLNSVERAELSAAFEVSDGEIVSALESLTSETKAKTDKLLEQGFRLSNELDRLNQRGVSVVFEGDSVLERLKGVFSIKPALLFAAGRKEIALERNAPITFSLAGFEKVGCEGVFVADRPIEVLLRNKSVAGSLRSMRAVVVSDAMQSRANIADSEEIASAGNTTEGGCPRTAESVFVSGSRSQKTISQNVQSSLEAITAKGFMVLIGDSERGVDKEITDFLRAPLYKNVVVFTVSSKPRIRLENEWSVEIIASNNASKPRERQAEKDRAMAERADWGMAVLNPIEKNRYGSLQVSSGTLRNVVQMLLQGKSVKLFYLYEGELLSRNLKCLEDLGAVIDSYQSERLSAQEREAVLTAKGVAADEDAAFAKYRKIAAKYKSILKAETSHLKKAAQSGISAQTNTQQTLPFF